MNQSSDDYQACAGCISRITCWLNGCNSAKVEAPSPATDAQDSSYRAEIERLTSKLAIQSKISRDAGIERERLSKELTAANDALIAARSQIADLTHRVTVSANHCAALIAEQKEAAADRQRELREYATTRQFHQQSRGVSIPTTEWDVTVEEDEAFATIPARTSVEIRLDDIEQRMERVENAYTIQQGRINTAHDRLDGLKGI